LVVEASRVAFPHPVRIANLRSLGFQLIATDEMDPVSC